MMGNWEAQPIPPRFFSSSFTHKINTTSLHSFVHSHFTLPSGWLLTWCYTSCAFVSYCPLSTLFFSSSFVDFEVIDHPLCSSVLTLRHRNLYFGFISPSLRYIYNTHFFNFQSLTPRETAQMATRNGPGPEFRAVQAQPERKSALSPMVIAPISSWTCWICSASMMALTISSIKATSLDRPRPRNTQVVDTRPSHSRRGTIKRRQ